MDRKYSFICKSAKQGKDGLDALGIFEILFAQGFPAIIENLTYVICLKFNAFETGKHKYTINIVDDGKIIIQPYHNETTVGDNLETIILTKYPKIIFPHKGNYQIDFILDGELVFSDPLIIELIH